MGRRPAMSMEQSNLAIGMFRDGMGVRGIVLHYGVSASTISRLRDRFGHTGSVKDHPHSGRHWWPLHQGNVSSKPIHVSTKTCGSSLCYITCTHDTSNHPKPTPFMWYIRPKTVRRYNVNSTTRTRKIELGQGPSQTFTTSVELRSAHRWKLLLKPQILFWTFLNSCIYLEVKYIAENSVLLNFFYMVYNKIFEILPLWNCSRNLSEFQMNIPWVNL